MSNSNEQIGSERRKYKRIDLVTEVKYAVLKPTLSQSGLIKNISEKGLCLLLDEKLNVGDILWLEFSLPEEKPEYIKALAEVRWQKEEKDKFLTGVKFIS